MVKNIEDYMKQAGYKSLVGSAKNRMVNKLIRDGVLIPREDVVFIKKGADSKKRKAVTISILTESGCRKLEKKLVEDDGMPWDIMPEEKADDELPFNEPIAEPETKPVDKHTFYETAMNTINDLKQKIADMEKEVLFAKSVKASGDCINVGMMARILLMNGIDTSERKLFKWLRENEWIEDVDDYKNIPTEKAIESGYMKFNECAITTNVGRVHISFTPKITGEGQEYFTDIFLGDRDEQY